MQITTIKDNYNKRDGSLYGKKNIEESVAMLYHENSKFTTHSIRLQGEIMMGFNNPFVVEKSSQPYKHYPGCEQFDLSIYEQIKPQVNLFDALHQRRSTREYNSDYQLSLNELAILLYHSYGVTQRVQIESFDLEGSIGLRNVPSGGALYPLELYVVIFNAHIPSGLYHYRPDINCLEQIKTGEFAEDLLKIVQAEPYVDMASASAVIISTGMIERSFIKYGDRGYRFLLQESGFVGQTITLLAESANLGTCMLGGYIDDKVNEFLGIDGVFETINNLIVVGGKVENNTTP